MRSCAHTCRTDKYTNIELALDKIGCIGVFMNFYRLVKRLFDISLSSCSLILLSPLLMIISLFIKLDSSGPVLFTQERIGIFRRRFTIYKFRTMKINAPKDIPTHILEKPESHITGIGNILRKTSLDELPQLFNVLRGDMSMIGPRPALWNQLDLIHERDKYGANDVLPGISGWAQVNGRDVVTIEEKAKLDGEYVSRRSIGFDIKCFVLTIRAVITRKGIAEGGQR